MLVIRTGLHRLFYALSIGVFVLNMVGAASAKESVTFYAVNFPPYEFEYPAQPDLRGFDVDVIIAAFNRVNIQAEIEFLPWNRIVSLTKSGSIAGMVSCARKEERDNYVRYSLPISHSTHSFVVTDKYQGPPLRTLNDAKGLRNLVVSGYTTEKELKSAGVGFETAITDQLAIARLLHRPYDTFYASRENVEYLAQEQAVSQELKIFDILKIPYHLCFSKKWAGSALLQREFNRGLAMIKKDGTYQDIHNKYR